MQSMTGFGRSESTIGSSCFTIEIKSVNHRFFDARFRLPHTLSLFEFQLSDILKTYFERGSFDISVKQRLEASSSHCSFGTRFVVDEVAAKSFIEGCEWLSKTYNTVKTPSLEVLTMINRVFIPIEEASDVTGIWGEFKNLFEKTVSELKKMRLAEGKHLKNILITSLVEIEKTIESLRILAPRHPEKIKEKLELRMSAWKLSTPIDTARLEWEVALLAEKADITEEIDRLTTHIKEFYKMIEGEKPIGRKLDFLTQELHRETNTIGSKATLIEITRLSVELKSWIEKLREQVQNVE